METNGTALTLNQVNTIQLEAETALWSINDTLRHLAKVPGFAGAKQQALALRQTLEYVVNEVNKLEVTND